MKKMLKNFWKIKNMTNFAVAKLLRGVAQLAARHVRDVEVGSSSLLTPTSQNNLTGLKPVRLLLYCYTKMPSYEVGPRALLCQCLSF